ncbi:MAG TPA: alkaline phosphatase PhoX [Allosphingosinicella sp.]|nr:alkaline phosphatase PhoX [Allosphingosinicella sp.]
MAFGGLALGSCGRLGDFAQRVPGFRTAAMVPADPYGPLARSAACPELDLPRGFTCEIVSELGEQLTGGGAVPDSADGMGSFTVDSSHVALVRNHELTDPLKGGTTTIVYDYKEGKRREQYRSLVGTRRNCAGGATPWGTWLSCEEDLTRGHGFVYEVPALADGAVRRSPLTQLGRFNHEAAAVDRRTAAIYMTEDQIDGLFYRFLPDSAASPLGAGRLQALAFRNEGDRGLDVRNWRASEWRAGDRREVKWETLPAEWGLDDPRKKARREVGAIGFACGEGIYVGASEVYFVCTSGGAMKSGQIMRYDPHPTDPQLGTLRLFLESTDPASFNFGDNLAVAPNGHLIVAEDPYFGGEGNFALREVAGLFGSPAPCYLRGVTPEGAVYPIARLRGGSELAGVCFSPDGSTLFVNRYAPARTYAIRGPWQFEIDPDWRLYQAAQVSKTALPQ